MDILLGRGKMTSFHLAKVANKIVQSCRVEGSGRVQNGMLRRDRSNREGGRKVIREKRMEIDSSNKIKNAKKERGNRKRIAD